MALRKRVAVTARQNSYARYTKRFFVRFLTQFLKSNQTKCSTKNLSVSEALALAVVYIYYNNYSSRPALKDGVRQIVEWLKILLRPKDSEINGIVITPKTSIQHAFAQFSINRA